MSDRTDEARLNEQPDRFEYGVLLPHFGRHLTTERVRGAGALAERLGFDSIWCRDHVVQQPHGHEDPDLTFLDPFVTLSTVAATTERVKLATAILIPHRHPIHAALLLGSLDFVAGPGRVIAGWGIGNWDSEFEAIGMGGWDRKALLEEYVGIIRSLWSGDLVSHHSDHYNFDDVQISPVPSSEHPVPLWYGGNSAAAVRRAVEYCDGWVASRMPISSFIKRMGRLRRLAGEASKPEPDAAVVPYISPASTVEKGLERINLGGLLEDLRKYEPPPPSGSFDSYEDVGGAAIAGPADVLIERVRQFQTEGARHFIFDLRPCLKDWEDQLAFLGESVLSPLRREDGRRPV